VKLPGTGAVVDVGVPHRTLEALAVRAILAMDAGRALRFVYDTIPDLEPAIEAKGRRERERLPRIGGRPLPKGLRRPWTMLDALEEIVSDEGKAGWTELERVRRRLRRRGGEDLVRGFDKLVRSAVDKGLLEERGRGQDRVRLTKGGRTAFRPERRVR
jgi:hypothetical protein